MDRYVNFVIRGPQMDPLILWDNSGYYPSFEENHLCTIYVPETNRPWYSDDKLFTTNKYKRHFFVLVRQVTLESFVYNYDFRVLFPLRKEEWLVQNSVDRNLRLYRGWIETEFWVRRQERNRSGQPWSCLRT